MITRLRLVRVGGQIALPRRVAPLHLVGTPGVRAMLLTNPSDHPGVSPRVDALEALYTALDGRELILRGHHWKIEVFSACKVTGACYIQLALQGVERHMLTLRVAPSADFRAVVPRLLSWLLHPTPSGEILEIHA